MKVIIVDNGSKNIETHTIVEPNKEFGQWICDENKNTAFLFPEKHISRKFGDEDAVRYIYHLKCSKCHKVTCACNRFYDFCPNCGSMMITTTVIPKE